MKLNDKYEKVLDNLEKLIDQAPNSMAAEATLGLILRQIVELHQKVDELSDKIDLHKNWNNQPTCKTCKHHGECHIEERTQHYQPNFYCSEYKLRENTND